MYLNKKYFALLVLTLASLTVFAQVTIQSPYSKFGLGNLRGASLPQFRGMGGIATAVNSPNGYSNINVVNPASYAGISLTTVDAGMSGSMTTLRRGNVTEKSFNSTFSHIAMAFPTGKSAISIGLLPYSELGYEFKSQIKLDTVNFDQVYQGEGGLSKAFIGYGHRFGNKFRLGANLEYVFGNLIQSKTNEPVDQPAALNSRIQEKNSVYGLTAAYGAQYDFIVSKKVTMTLGYSGTASTKIRSKQTMVVTRFAKDYQGNELPALIGDTAQNISNPAKGLHLPLTHNFGIVFQQYNKWMVGADFRIGKWSGLTINNVNQGLEDTYGVSIGTQFTPDIAAVSGYLNRMEYRFGLQYDKTYVKIANTDIKQMSASIGFGFPFSSFSRGTFSKLNFTAEVGQRGTLSNNLIKENFVNFHMGITLNDKWFYRFKFD